MPARHRTRSISPFIGWSASAAMAGQIMFMAAPAAAEPVTQVPGTIVITRAVPNQSVAGPRLPGEANRVATGPDWLMGKLMSLSLEPLSESAASEVAAPLSAIEGQMSSALKSGLHPDIDHAGRHGTAGLASSADGRGSTIGQALGATATGINALHRGLESGR